MPDRAKAWAPFAAGTAALVPASRQMGDFDATAAGTFPARSAATLRSHQMALKRAKIKPKNNEPNVLLWLFIKRKFSLKLPIDEATRLEKRARAPN